MCIRDSPGADRGDGRLHPVHGGQVRPARHRRRPRRVSGPRRGPGDLAVRSLAHPADDVGPRAFVPDQLVWRRDLAPAVDDPLYRLGPGGLIAPALGPIALGLATSAFEAMRDLTQRSRPARGPSSATAPTSTSRRPSGTRPTRVATRWRPAPTCGRRASWPSRRPSRRSTGSTGRQASTRSSPEASETALGARPTRSPAGSTRSGRSRRQPVASPSGWSRTT